jgi:hypothetical protein
MLAFIAGNRDHKGEYCEESELEQQMGEAYHNKCICLSRVRKWPHHREWKESVGRKMIVEFLRSKLGMNSMIDKHVPLCPSQNQNFDFNCYNIDCVWEDEIRNISDCSNFREKLLTINPGQNSNRCTRQMCDRYLLG